VSARVAMGSLTLVTSGWGAADAPPAELAYAQFDALNLLYEIRRDSYRYAFSVEALRMDDRLNRVDGARHARRSGGCPRAAPRCVCGVGSASLLAARVD